MQKPSNPRHSNSNQPHDFRIVSPKTHFATQCHRDRNRQTTSIHVGQNNLANTADMAILADTQKPELFCQKTKSPSLPKTTGRHDALGREANSKLEAEEKAIRPSTLQRKCIEPRNTRNHRKRTREESYQRQPQSSDPLHSFRVISSVSWLKTPRISLALLASLAVQKINQPNQNHNLRKCVTPQSICT